MKLWEQLGVFKNKEMCDINVCFNEPLEEPDFSHIPVLSERLSAALTSADERK